MNERGCFFLLCITQWSPNISKILYFHTKVFLLWDRAHETLQPHRLDHGDTQLFLQINSWTTMYVQKSSWLLYFLEKSLSNYMIMDFLRNTCPIIETIMYYGCSITNFTDKKWSQTMIKSIGLQNFSAVSTEICNCSENISYLLHRNENDSL